MRRRRTSLLGGLLYPPLVGSDCVSKLLSHSRPLPDFRNALRQKPFQNDFLDTFQMRLLFPGSGMRLRFQFAMDDI